MSSIKKLPNTLIRGILWVYQCTFSPSTGIFRFLPGYPAPSCVFYPTCSVYSRECFKKYPFLKAFTLTILRLRRCHPGTPPTVDMP